MTNEQQADLKKLEALNAPSYKVKYLAVTDRDLRRFHELLTIIGKKEAFGKGQDRPDKDAWALDTARRVETLFRHGDHVNSKN